MRLLPKSIHRCRRYPTKFNSGRDIPLLAQTTVSTSAFATASFGASSLPWDVRGRQTEAVIPLPSTVATGGPCGRHPCTSVSWVARALLHGPEQIADLPVPVADSPGAVRIGHPERGHLVEYLAPKSVFNSLPRQRSCPHLGPDDRFVTIDRVLHHASLGAA